MSIYLCVPYNDACSSESENVRCPKLIDLHITYGFFP